ncbi:MAG: hypothetical protein NC299_10175 [Lachnospiraceae bacterium]|nr:hypothetical protein [Ruminococcus sp.]MCM1275713.1 hypothetical protein [Lachnospiraceae bacterium]
MPKKLTIASAAALALLVAVVAIMLNTHASESPSLPRRVSVYLPERGEILTLSGEEFLAGCVEGLVGDASALSEEALVAIAAAERTRAVYALSVRSGFQNLGADFTVSADFPFDNAEKPAERTLAAVKSAEKLLLTYGGEPINPQLCGISSGRTDDCPPVSPSKALPCDIGAAGFESRTAFTTEEVRRALHKSGTLSADCSEWFGKAVYADTGTLLYTEFNGERITGAALRETFGLRSVAITVEYAEDKFYFTCLGLGENKGMSVNAADFMARNGSTAEEILKAFYPGAELVGSRP